MEKQRDIFSPRLMHQANLFYIMFLDEIREALARDKTDGEATRYFLSKIDASG